MRTASNLLGTILLLCSAQTLWAAGQAFTALTVTASDPNGDPLTYRWEVVEYNGQPYVPTTHPPVTFDGVYPDTAKPAAGRTAGFSVAGSYRFRAIVSDGAASVSNSSLVFVVLNRGFRMTPDFNGDRKADVLFRHPSTGTVELWLMNGTAAEVFDTKRDRLDVWAGSPK